MYIKKAIGILEYIKKWFDDQFVHEEDDAIDTAIFALKEIQQYRSIGTVEECRETREKQKAKKPEKKPDKYSDLTQHYYCPSCGRYFGQRGIHDVILFNKEKYCQGDNCGQAIDWSEV